MKSFTRKAFAKVNPILHVGALRPDGYHDIDTVMQLISLHDNVSFEVSDDLSLSCSISALSGEENIAWKGVRLLSELIKVPTMRIHIDKKIPVEAGLGGGSSDCAAVLLGLQQAARLRVSSSDLLAIAAACGSDVPFFLYDTPRARVAGRGDVVTPEPPDAPTYIVIAKPNVGVSTKDAYAALDSIKRTEVSNDFELVAPSESLELAERMRALGCCRAVLCGSGSAVYGEATSQDAARAIEMQLVADGYWSVSAHTLESLDG